MRTMIVAAAVAASLIGLGTEARAQIFNRNRYNQPAPPPAIANQPAPVDPGTTRASMANQDPGTNVVPADRTYSGNNVVLPKPSIDPDVAPPIPLPTGPLEPYLLTKENGPFMVLAYTFKGPNAPRMALALVLELREKYHLPAYILLPKKAPGRSLVRGVPPQAPTFATKDDLGLPEILRTLDEAAVLVGDEKTTADSVKLMKHVKTLHPVCIDGVSHMFSFRKGQGLSRALRTNNPLIPAEELYQATAPDNLIAHINDGPHNIRYCPGRYTLEIATFRGRTSVDPDNDARFKGMFAGKSPLETAHDDAEKLAEALAKDKEILKTGFKPYVYHDRYSSRVTIGSFDAPDDPAARRLHDRLIELAFDLNAKKVTDSMIVPASALLDLDSIKPMIAPRTAGQDAQAQARK